MKRLLILAALAIPALAADTPCFDIRSYGAKGDAVTLATFAINKAIDAAHAAYDEAEAAYPEPRMFGVIAAYGFFLRHVNGSQFNDVEISDLKPDLRPALWLDGVKNAEFFHVKAQKEPAVPAFVLKSVENFQVQLSPGVADTKLSTAGRKEL